MRTETLLVEIGTEELPPKALKSLAQAFASGIEIALQAAELSFDSVRYFAAPRRLAVEVKGLAETQADKVIEKRGPAVNVAFDEQGNPSRAAEGWARSNGITVEQAERLVTDKGEWLLHKAEVKGQSIHDLLQDLVEKAVSKLPIPKVMRWGDSNAQFIRPVHTLCAFYGSDSVVIRLFDKQSKNVLQGHRFHGSGRVEINHAEEYAAALEKEYVLADFAQRREKIKQELDRVAGSLSLSADYSDDLLDEIASLVEWPVIMQASFDESFLAVPKEALIYTMKDDQKYVPLLDDNGALAPIFLFVANIESNEPRQVIEGNERVIRPRLADAQFFFETDKKSSLESRLDSLTTVVFQKQLGTLADKSQRIAKVAEKIAGLLNASTAHAARAGLLSKTDLMTNMVMEFPDVQGVMGMHYANHDGENPAVANALFEQYLPRFAGDKIATDPISISVALADKLDTLVGIFGIGQLPKGDKDPFALRRAAIGVLRTIIDNGLSLDLVELVGLAYAELADKLTNSECQEQVIDFSLGRFAAMYQDRGISPDVIQAVSSKRPTQPTDYDARIQAVSQFKSNAAAESLAAAHKRIANILNKNKVDVSLCCDTELLTQVEEKSLHSAMQSIDSKVSELHKQRAYADLLAVIASLREPVDAFFDNVMVMAEDEAIRNNRLGLLNELRWMLESVADISKLVVVKN
ncbi:glycine--tRNA ligase subunit beta [Alteromonas sp. ASW11-36]|uniref:Glycine--tRNA ligase beta subunit n=1 Tax=Alteromonas arenosi TaxID=3055817 RepID=A0ABT7ST50_9ALTE|nr:glycine--tRNA ligase subunit beta [Alteromonas sp. ASW11-36]MDM7859350.1 glycine--tRNA ligase subunit beta [Alteromonas sp. ASW11-36]